MDETIVENKQCPQCGAAFGVRDVDVEFYKKVSPVVAGQKYLIPTPRLCPDCRRRRRVCFRNERNLYKRPCNFSNKEIISIYSPDKVHKVYDQEIRRSDKRDGITYGVDFDFSKTFDEQFKVLQRAVPRIALFNVNPENSHYCQQAYDNKNCYLCFVVTGCEECMHVSHSNRLNKCFDCTLVQDSETSYECLDSDKIYGCKYCDSCQESNNLLHCSDCIGCSNCIGCIGLRNKSFHIFNKEYPRDQYEEEKIKLMITNADSLADLGYKFKQFAQGQPHRYLQNINSHNCLGNYIINSKNLYKVFDAFELEDCAYSTWIFESKDCHDIYGMGTSNLVYYSLGVEKLNTAAFCTFVSHSRNAYYSDLCFNCEDIFGCVGLRNKSYCIFNKQYTKEEYEALVAKIITHMQSTGERGEFFTPAVSPFGYNETVAQEHFPSEKAQVVPLGFNRSDYVAPFPQVDKILQAKDLPKDIKETFDDILQQAIECEITHKPFRIMKGELEFYRKNQIPLPRRHPDQRHMDRLKRRNPRKLFDRRCNKCGADIKTAYAPERPEIVYCEQCYNKEIYG